MPQHYKAGVYIEPIFGLPMADDGFGNLIYANPFRSIYYING